MAKYRLRNAHHSVRALLDTGAHLSLGLSDFTFCAWVNCDAFFYGHPSSTTNMLICYGGDYFAVPWQIRVRGDTGSFDFYLDQETTCGAYGASRVADGRWHFMAITGDRSEANGLTIYTDGEPDTDTRTGDLTTYAATDIATNIALFCQAYPEPDLHNYPVYLSQFRFYKTILTPSQIRDIYNFGRGRLVDETQFASIADGWYSEFDDGSGTVVSGRVCSGGEWSDSNCTVDASMWNAGAAVPFARGGQRSAETKMLLL